MKKTLVFLGLMSIGVAYAQDGKVGINTNGNSLILGSETNVDSSGPQATLDIRVAKDYAGSNKTTPEGILIPRVSSARVKKMTGVKESTLVYVTDNVNDASFTGTGKGFYYYDAAATKWIKMVSGVVNTGNAQASDGTFVKNIRSDNRTTVVADQLEDNSSTKDYFVIMTGNPTRLNLPAPSTSNKGRELCFYNPGSNGVTVRPQPIGQVQGVDASATACFISSGTNWVTSKGY